MFVTNSHRLTPRWDPAKLAGNPMELIPQKLFPVTKLPIFLVIPTKLIPQTKKAAGNIFGGGGMVVVVVGPSLTFHWPLPRRAMIQALTKG